MFVLRATSTHDYTNMRSFLYTLFTISVLSPFVAAHMDVSNPPPYRSKLNHNVAEANIDYSMTSPLAADGSNFPCKGYNVDWETPAGASTGTVTAGQKSTISIEGTASHEGGSCQISLSFDGGKSFKVIKSYIGNCVRVTSSGVDPNQTYEYTVPSDAKSGDAMLTWSWFNRVGNREMYMNCATITINGGGQSTLDSYPDIFKCHIGNGCTIPEGTDVVFQNPGNDVTYDQGNLGNATLGDPENGMGTPLPMPYGSGVAVGVFLGLGAGVIIGLVGYYAWTWYKLRSAAVDKPTKA